MAKKSSSRQRPSKQRVTSEDRERYGEVVDVFHQTFAEYEMGVAADMSGWEPVRKVLIFVSMLALVGLIAGLVPEEKNYPLMVVSIVVSLSCTMLVGKWGDLVKGILRKTNLGRQVADGDQRVVVCSDALHIEHGDEVEDLPLSEITDVKTDEDAALARFSGKRLAYIPRAALGEARFKTIVDLLRK